MNSLVCIAMAIYFEARSQSFEGQLAVGNVIMHRVASQEYPTEPCEVVEQGPWRGGPARLGECQFSFYCDGKSDKPQNQDAWMFAGMVAGIALLQLWDVTDGATHYHATYTRPKWAANYHQTIQIQQHIFYR